MIDPQLDPYVAIISFGIGFLVGACLMAWHEACRWDRGYRRGVADGMTEMSQRLATHRNLLKQYERGAAQ